MIVLIQKEIYSKRKSEYEVETVRELPATKLKDVGGCCTFWTSVFGAQKTKFG